MEPARPELSIVIPAYREAAKIERDIRRASEFLDRHFAGRGEIVVVDDGSPDDTADRAEAMTRTVPVLRVVRCRENRGKGHALRVGVAATRGRRVMFADAGSCVPYADALRGWATLDDGAALAHGSRRLPETVVEVAPPLHRRIGSRVFRRVLGLFLGIPGDIRDTQCGFKMYDGDVARTLFGECFTDGFMLDIELIRRARKRGLPIAEFPVHWRNDGDTRYHPVFGTWRNLRELVEIRRRA